MIAKFKEASNTAKLGYIGLVVTVILGLSNISGKAWTQVTNLDSRYAKQAYVVEQLDKTNQRIAMVEKDLKVSQFLQLEQQLFEMRMRYGADMSKWTDAQRELYWEKKAKYDNLKQELGKK
jgi:hypothetical protein